MARTIGRAFKISKNQAHGYAYVSAPRKRPRRRAKLKRNGGVTHIASINGRGAYARRSVPKLSRRTPRSTRRMSSNARLKRAKAALTRTMRKNFGRKLKSNSARKRTTTAVTKRRIGMRRNASRKQRAASLKNLKKARAARRAKSKPRTTKARKTRRVRKPKTTRARKVRKTVARKTKRRVRRARPKTKLTANRRRPRRVKRNATKRRRALRRNAWRGDAARHSAASKKGWRKRRRATGTRKRRKSRPMTKRRRQLAARKAARTRAAKKSGLTANRRSRRRVRKNPSRRRRIRRNARMSYVSNRRRSRRRVKRNKGMRRNKRRMRRNSGIAGAFRTGGIIMAAFLGHKLVTALIRDLAFKPAVEAVAPEAAVPTSGLGQLNAYSGVLVGLGTAIVGILAAKKFIKTPETRQLVIGGLAASWLQTAIVALLDKLGQPKVATMLAGVEDGTAANISAMYGLGAGTSIMPEYAAIRGLRGGRGMGEYFKSGMGEYFGSGVNGVGEYFNSGVNGLGALKPYEAAAGMGYTHNPDLYQAAAGMGSSEHNGNHIDPASDLDRELTIAEAAAGVGGMGQLYQAAAGLGQAPIRTLPRANTWIPGMSNAPIWAGVREVNDPQATNEMLTAGILQTDGGQGVFG